MLKLIERGIEGFVDAKEFLLHSLNFRFVLDLALLEVSYLPLDLLQVGLSPLYVLLGLHQEYLLLFVVLLNSLGQGILSIF